MKGMLLFWLGQISGTEWQLVRGESTLESTWSSFLVLEEMEKHTAHLLASSQFGRQAHGQKLARYMVCKTERKSECGFPKSPPGYCEMQGQDDDDSDISHSGKRLRPKSGSRWGQCKNSKHWGGGQQQGHLRWASGDHNDALIKPRDAKARVTRQLHCKWRPEGLKRPHPFTPDQSFPKTFHCYPGEEQGERRGLPVGGFICCNDLSAKIKST